MPIAQAPLPSGFGPTSTAGQVIEGVDLTGKVAIVTGGYAGVGLETTRALAGAGATVIVPARTPDKARKALNGIPRVEQSKVDLLDPASIDAF
ncbi:MAG TPA: SDR family NAD(P)-dependent oxidoreductase, partial [Edaphobacter sp.]|nr:SDR family NAD(P)-dependent oxidoreductase [Edaphobacter sp.]